MQANVCVDNSIGVLKAEYIGMQGVPNSDDQDQHIAKTGVCFNRSFNGNLEYIFDIVKSKKCGNLLNT